MWRRQYRSAASIVALILLGLGFPVAVRAQAQTTFSAAVSGYDIVGCYFLAGPLYWPSLEWMLWPGQSPVPRFSEDVVTIASSDGQNVFAIARGFPQELRIARVMLGSRPLYNASEAFFSGLPGYYGGTLAVAESGRVFATAFLPSRTHVQLAVISRGGVLERTIDLPVGAGNLAVAPDGCTVFFADGVVIRRLNGCTGGALPPFSHLGGRVVDLDIAPTGHVVVLTEKSLVELGTDGTLLRTFSLAGLDPTRDMLDAVDISADGSVVGVAAMRGCEKRGQVIAFAVHGGREVWRQDTIYLSKATGLVMGSHAAAAIPALSFVPLMLLATTLAALAMAAIRR